MQHAVDASGRVLRDNVWGPQDEDATRRDFTVNAMYYDPETQVVVDYHKGIQDAKKTLRMIGDPPRATAKPVRIIRAVRFAAKLSPWVSPSTPRRPRRWCSRRRCWPMCPQSRMFDEMLKAAANRPRHCHHRAIAQAGMAKGHLPPAGRGRGTCRHAVCEGGPDGHRPPRARR